jgi:hypothetical protein
MLALDPVDSVEVHVLVDNVTDNLSSVPSFVETEIAALGRRRAGTWMLGGSCLCCAAHGLSCLITTHSGSVSRTLLFDTGPEDCVFEQNVSRLGETLPPSTVGVGRTLRDAAITSIVSSLQAAFVKATRTPEYSAALKARGAEPLLVPRADVGRYITSASERWLQVANELELKKA